MDIKDKNGWLVYSVRKVVEYSAIFLAAWQLGVPAANQYIDNRIKENYKKESFREVLSRDLNVPSDRVHVLISNWFKEHEQLVIDFNKIKPHVISEITNIHPRLIIKNGLEYWVANDGIEYMVHRTPDGLGVYFINNKWEYIYK
jgi:hypothetical protein